MQMSWLSRFRQTSRTSMAEGEQRNATDEQTKAPLGDRPVAITVADSQNVVIGDGTVQHNSFAGPDGFLTGTGEPDEDWTGDRGEDPPEPDWDPGDEVDDEGGMSEVDPMADEAARREAEYFGCGPELDR
jgi:hypothetical protein